MTPTPQAALGRLLDPRLAVGSGVYAAVDTSLTMSLNSRGEYRYEGLDDAYDGPIDQLIQVAAFGDGPNENEIARRRYGDQPGVVHDSVAGYYLGAFAGWASDSEIRANGSSGGLTTWVLLELLRKQLVDGVIHMGTSSPGEPLFSYRISRTADEIRDSAKSRYYPGELSSSLREVLETPGRYVVVGIWLAGRRTALLSFLNLRHLASRRTVGAPIPLPDA